VKDLVLDAVQRYRWWTRGVVSVVLFTSLTFVFASGAFAYNPVSAASFADRWVLSSNWCTGRLCFTGSGNDCANFVSYSLQSGGGYAEVGYPTGSTTDDHNWYVFYNSYYHFYRYTHSWSVANDLYWFEIWHYPGGFLAGTDSGDAANINDGLIPGDLVFYDWDSNGTQDHVAIQVAHGTDPDKGWYGDLVDAHTNNRYHAFWSLRPYNSQWRTTTIYKVGIYSGN